MARARGFGRSRRRSEAARRRQGARLALAFGHVTTPGVERGEDFEGTLFRFRGNEHANASAVEHVVRAMLPVNGWSMNASMPLPSRTDTASSACLTSMNRATSTGSLGSSMESARVSLRWP